ncbi:YggT family protein [Sulfurimonas sp. SAG-AH-194-I05]|nr:YggT family protein [Sulfurimonas sp. SAG-AH-194-I05]MDF1875832.1 YggT family protein [Sulfurimonas sp. SAG-AH-194-I05]
MSELSELGVVVLKLGSLFSGVLEVYIWVIIISSLLSFVNPDPYNPIVQFLYRITNPAYSFVRKLIKTNYNGLDLAPLVIIIGLQVVIILMEFLFSSLAKIV